MNILFCIPRLETGGAEVFLTRLALALKEKGHRPCIFETSEYADIHTPLRKRLKNQIPVFKPGGPNLLYKIADKLDKNKSEKKWRTALIKYFIKKVIKNHNIEIVNSHVHSADYWTTCALKLTSVPLVITMHGCYEDPKLNSKQALTALKRADAIIYIAEKNLSFIRQQQLNVQGKLIRKIYNGYSGTEANEPVVTRKEIGCRETDFIFVMVARGIPQKGWQNAIDAFKTVHQKHPSSRLILIGDSEYLRGLKNQNSNRSIIFLGHQSNPQQYLRISNVGLLPTWYKNESLPNSITEYLFSGIPAISSDVGEIKNMLVNNTSAAGVALVNPSVPSLSDAMMAYIENRDLYLLHKQNTLICAQKFNMDNCITAYLETFNELLLKTKRGARR